MPRPRGEGRPGAPGRAGGFRLAAPPGLGRTAGPRRAHAVVFTGPGRVSYQEIECPEPGAEDVVIDLRQDQADHLCDLAADPREATNLASRRPDLVAEFRALHAAWVRTLPPRLAEEGRPARKVRTK